MYLILINIKKGYVSKMQKLVSSLLKKCCKRKGRDGDERSTPTVKEVPVEGGDVVISLGEREKIIIVKKENEYDLNKKRAKGSFIGGIEKANPLTVNNFN